MIRRMASAIGTPVAFRSYSSSVFSSSSVGAYCHHEVHENNYQGKTMKKILIAAIFLLPLQVSAEHMDVIQFKLNDDCSFEKYMAIVADFNVWGKAYGYNPRSPTRYRMTISRTCTGWVRARMQRPLARPGTRGAMRKATQVQSQRNCRQDFQSVGQTFHATATISTKQISAEIAGDGPRQLRGLSPFRQGTSSARSALSGTS